jgi:hypothetical protein
MSQLLNSEQGMGFECDSRCVGWFNYKKIKTRQPISNFGYQIMNEIILIAAANFKY